MDCGRELTQDLKIRTAVWDGNARPAEQWDAALASTRPHPLPLARSQGRDLIRAFTGL